MSGLFLVHVLRDWFAHPMVQADQAGEIFNFALVAVVASVLFGRERSALDEARTAHEETLRALASRSSSARATPQATPSACASTPS